MREWNLKHGEPLALTLASDLRTDITDYCDDQIWEIVSGTGEPPALALQTTFGLRARNLRIFPRFLEGEIAVNDPVAFVKPPVYRQIFPNYLQILFSPLREIDVLFEARVPGSHALAGRIQITNQDNDLRQLSFELVAQLAPNSGQRMAIQEFGSVVCLAGSTSNLTPILFLTGGALSGNGSYPSLTLELTLEPGESRQFTWVEAALSDTEASFQMAHRIAGQKWDAVYSHLQMLNSGLIEVFSGDAEWDAAFMLAQKQALGLLVGPGTNLPYASFVQARQPDHGYSMRGDGSDYGPLWNGQSPLDACMLFDLILPNAPEIAQGILENFLAVQQEDGFIDWKPGLAGQRGRLLATPLLAHLAWRIFEHSEQTSFLEVVYPRLLKFWRTWFSSQNDRDGDMIPEWEHPLQGGLEESSLYATWQTWSKGIEIKVTESPELCAFLYEESQCLARMAELLNDDQALDEILEKIEALRTAIQSCWDPEANTYFDRDRQTHLCPNWEALGNRTGPGEILLQRKFEHPIRLLVQIESIDEKRYSPIIYIHGCGAEGHNRVERIPSGEIKWALQRASITGDNVYTSVEYLQIDAVGENDLITIFSAGYQSWDLPLILPIWAGAATPENAKSLIENTLLNPERYWRNFGIPSQFEPAAPQGAQLVNILWNTLIGEGMLAYGYRGETVDLLNRLMRAIVQSLKHDGAFRSAYHANTGNGLGERNNLSGFAPLRLFLSTLGVKIFSQQKVAIVGFNPFPQPVTVKYRGLTVFRQKDKTSIIFPDGQTVLVDDPAPRTVSLELISI